MAFDLSTFKVVGVGVVALAGYAWAGFKILLERRYSSVLEVQFSHDVLRPVERHALVAFRIHLTNKGQTRIVAKQRTAGAPSAYDDGDEKIPYSCTLAVRRLAARQPTGWLDWYNAENFDGEAIYANFLTDYEDTTAKYTNFWLEPKESVDLSAIMRLPPGAYLAKTTFVGKDGGKNDFWSNVAPVSVAKPITSS